MIRVSALHDKFAVQTSYSELDLAKAKGIPQRRWLKSERAWLVPPTLQNLLYIREAWPEAEWHPETQPIIADIEERMKARNRVLQGKEVLPPPAFDGIPFKLRPRAHQVKALTLARDMKSFGYLLDMGTGKTKIILDDAAHQFRMNRIDALLVICPNGVKSNWVAPLPDPRWPDQVTTHMAPDIPYVAGCWISQPSAAEKKRFDVFIEQLKRRDPNVLKILVVNVEAIAVQRVSKFLEHFVGSFRTMIVVDESTRIKTPGARRTKAAKYLRKRCPIARIASGTPVIKSPLDAYSQFQFLDEDILGFSSYYSFRDHYAVMGGYQQRQVLFYKNLDELQHRIASCSFRVTKDECLDLPAKQYDQRRVSMTPAQAKAYETMRQDFYTVFGNQVITAPIVLTQLMRLQQITSGFLPQLDAAGQTVDSIPLCDPGHNPKVEEAIQLLEESGDQKVIIWSRFRPEIEAMADRLERAGYSFVQFHGGIKEKDRVEARRAFQHDPEMKVFLGNPQAGGIGLDLFAGSIMIFLSNSFGTEERVQAEDRAHRIGTTRNLAIYDILCPGTVDAKILATLRANKSVATVVMGDDPKDWI